MNWTRVYHSDEKEGDCRQWHEKTGFMKAVTAH